MASKPVTRPPLIPEKYIDYPSQRLYSIGLWSTHDVELNYLCQSDSNTYSTSGFDLFSYVAPLTFGLLPASWSSTDGHLQGQHTVRMSPISTARINPQNQKFCLSSTSKFALIPVLLNNTDIAGLRYTRMPLTSPNGLPAKLERRDVSARELKAISQTYQDLLQPTKPAVTGTTQLTEEDEYDEYDDDEDQKGTSDPKSNLQKSQNLVYLRIFQPGIVRLEQVTGASNVEARIVPGEVAVVPCPAVSFLDIQENPADSIQCAGQESLKDLTIDVYGVPPLSLRWSKSINGHKDQLLVEGIEGEHGHNHRTDDVVEDAVVSSGSLHKTKVVEPDRVQVPLTIALKSAGTYVYTLEEVADGVGNVIKVSRDGAQSDPSTSRSFLVLTRPSISFTECSAENPRPLLIGSEAHIAIRTTEYDPRDGPWEIDLNYQPSEGTSSEKRSPWKKVIKTGQNTPDVSFAARDSGDYTISSIKGKYSNLILRGTPPFVVYYRTQRDKEPPKELNRSFSSSRGEFPIQPERSGSYSFTFTALSDANYRRVALQGPSIDQIIRPRANADFAHSQTSGKNKREINSCAGEFIDVEVDLKGTGPWNLDVEVIGPQSADVLHFDGIETSRKTLKIPIPSSIAKAGGSFEIALVSVEDVDKCKRTLTNPGLRVNIKRTRPTAKFYGSEEERHISVTENDKADLPLRLTGNEPWTVRYRSTGSQNRVLSARLTSPNGKIIANEPGIYELLSVSDSLCPGTVASDAATYRVEWLPRPTARLSTETEATYVSSNNSYILKPVCEGVGAHADLELTGRPPFQIMYNIAQDNEQGGTRLLDQPTVNSIQPRTRFQLLTAKPGHIYYEVKQIGDSVYPLEENKNTVIPRSQRLLFEQQVAMRPSAYFKNRNRMTYCLHDTFVPLSSSSSDGVVVLEGRPPFTLTLNVKNVAASQTQIITVEIPSNAWKIDLPSYTFASVGPHRISIVSVGDSSNCAQSASDPLLSSIWVDVAETASIVPFENRQDLCVGELSQFQLEGIPPWTVGYRVNTKSYTKEIKTSPFSIIQQQAGEFAISSIAHQQKMCKAAVTDLRFNIHPLPSAKVGQGQKIFQDIHEGDQAEIVFTLVGEPPFTFTYQRSEPAKKGGKPGRILETHTVSRITTHEYSIFSALEEFMLLNELVAPEPDTNGSAILVFNFTFQQMVKLRSMIFTYFSLYLNLCRGDIEPFGY
ncbi:nucleoporin Pom152 [Coprinopsis marcescibilis]|uniref:Nucleoporin Pom152 n=1 Tax=Coprinopsis marcescibilis TaxID=230819 RepID=A0A5C3LDS7_COPMA|nr:nucleoporin Pom152 [Coprinopsis marcescibilis]